MACVSWKPHGDRRERFRTADEVRPSCTRVQGAWRPVATPLTPPAPSSLHCVRASSGRRLHQEAPQSSKFRLYARRTASDARIGRQDRVKEHFRGVREGPPRIEPSAHSTALTADLRAPGGMVPASRVKRAPCAISALGGTILLPVQRRDQNCSTASLLATDEARSVSCCVTACTCCMSTRRARAHGGQQTLLTLVSAGAPAIAS